jgi:hypothetical protein
LLKTDNIFFEDNFINGKNFFVKIKLKYKNEFTSQLIFESNIFLFNFDIAHIFEYLELADLSDWDLVQAEDHISIEVNFFQRHFAIYFQK